MTKESYGDFQRDIIQPKISNINSSVEKNKKYINKHRWKNIGSNIVLPLITFSVGKILDKSKIYDVKSEDYYLWRVQESFSK